MRSAVLILLLMMNCFAVAEEKIHIASGEYAPLTGKSLPEQGYLSHLVTLAYAEEGVAVEFHYMPWARSMEQSRKGLFPGTIFWFCTTERQKDFYCSEQPVKEGRVTIFRRADTLLGEWTSYEDLKDYKFGLTKGYSYDEEFLKSVDAGEIKAEIVSSDEQNIRKLLLGRIDLFLSGKSGGQELLRQHFAPEEAGQIVIESRPLVISDLHILFSKNHPDALKWRAQFDRGMQSLRSKPQFQQVRQNYIDGKYQLPSE